MRVSLGLSFHDEGTIVEYSTGDEWRCCPGYADFTQETGRIVHNLKEPESGCDTTDFQGSIDIKETKR